MSGNRIISLEDERKKKKNRQKKQIKSKSKFKKLNSQKRKKLVMIVLIGFLLFGFSLYKIMSLYIEKNKLTYENQKLIEERDKVKEASKDTDSLEIIEKKAREDLNLVLPGEVIYVLPDDSGKEIKKSED